MPKQNKKGKKVNFVINVIFYKMNIYGLIGDYRYIGVSEWQVDNWARAGKQLASA
jgi:hypothetical protein